MTNMNRARPERIFGLILSALLLACMLPDSHMLARVFADNENDGEIAEVANENDGEIVEVAPDDLGEQEVTGVEVDGVRDDGEKVLTFNLRGVTLEDFFALVARETGLRFLVREAVKDTRVTAFLPEVEVSAALDAILTVHGLGARKIDPGILLIYSDEDVPFDPAVDLSMELINLKYLDAADIKATLEPFLSEHGKIAVVDRSGYTGWDDGGGRGRGEERRRKVESRTIIVRERPQKLELIRPIIETMDVRPEQVLISAHIIEVKHDAIRDIGVDWSGARGDLLGDIDLGAFTEPGSAVAEPGMGLHFRRIAGRDRGELEAFLRALEEDAGANLLSSPRLLTLDSQECSIMVGERFPILLVDVDTETEQRTASLDYYEDVGIRLNVIPRIQHGNNIEMIIRPSISVQTDWVEARGTTATDREILLARYPVIDTRETETQISIQDGQTIVIGGLITEEKTDTVRGVPLLQSIPLLGYLFRREVQTTEKIDLLVFLSADIIRSPEEATEERVRKMGEGIVRVYENRLDVRGYPIQGGNAADLTDGAPYNIGERAILTATPNPGYEFKEWTGHTDLITTGTSTGAVISVTMEDEDAWLTANFQLIDYTLTLTPEPEAYGMVRDRPGADVYNIGDRVRIRATPNPGYEFAGWRGDTEHLEDTGAADTFLTIHDSDVGLAAIFDPVDYTLSFRTEPEGEIVEKGPLHIGDAITLEAEPVQGYRFSRWRGDTRHITEGTRNDSTVTITMPDSDLKLIADFEEIDRDE